MCHTKWCYGDCDECEAEKKREQEAKERETCQFSDGQVLESECGLSVSSTKQDSCGKCGYVFNYS